MINDIHSELTAFYNEGNISIILGKPGRGKTDFGLTLSEIAIKLGHKKLFTNIYVVENKNIVRVCTDLDLLKLFLKYLKDILLLLDEAGIFANSKEVMTETNRYLEKFIIMCRHFRMAVIFINQRNQLNLPTIRELSYMTVEKHNKTNATIFIDDYMINTNNIRKTNILYQTYSWASFRFILDWDLIYNKITTIDYNQALLELKKIIKNPEPYYNNTYLKEIKRG